MARRLLFAIGAVLLLWLLGFAIVMTRGYIFIALVLIGLTVWAGWVGWGFGARDESGR